MTEEAARAKRLYDAEKWELALAALQDVASGKTHDDEGNRQIAAFTIGKVLFKLNRFAEAENAFGTIAMNRSHVKHPETLLWLIKLASDASPPVASASDFARYEKEDVLRFHNTEQDSIYFAGAYYLGRGRMVTGRYAEALDFFALVPESAPLHARALLCANESRDKMH
jgi:hypothetical protein